MYLKNDLSKLHEIFCVLLVTVARSISDDSATRYVLSVLWMTSCFLIMGHIARGYWLIGRILKVTTQVNQVRGP